MTDFLTRLAERTLGVASAAQPLIAPRFAPGPPLPGADVSQTQPEVEESRAGPGLNPGAEAPAASARRLSTPPQVSQGEGAPSHRAVPEEMSPAGQHYESGKLPPSPSSLVRPIGAPAAQQPEGSLPPPEHAVGQGNGPGRARIRCATRSRARFTFAPGRSVRPGRVGAQRRARPAARCGAPRNVRARAPTRGAGQV